jgi:signal transduction histidine kinase/CheY-like chemotaxis protein
MFLDRNGYLEETFFTFSLSPIRDELWEVAGVFHPVTETTAIMISERRTRALRDVASKAGSSESVQAASSLILEALSQYRHDAPFVMLYQYEGASDQLKLLGATGVDADAAGLSGAVALDLAPWPFREVLATGASVLVADVTARAGHIPCADYPETTSQAFVIPITTNSLSTPFGFAVVGVSTRLPVNESYRHFIEMLGAAVSMAIGSALANQDERRKAAELTAIDEAKTAFFSNVSHEFRTPLTLMLGPLEDSLSDTEEPLLPRQRERQERINRNALRLLKLVNTLLDFSRIHSGRVDAAYRPTDLPQLTADLASIFRSAIEKAGLSFRVEMADLGESVFVDRDMWEKIVLNLLSNAFKFTHQGEIAVRLERRGDSACLTVRDTGTGIPESELPNLFQRFHRVQGSHGRTYEGSGIGLALIHELVKLHGGTIGVASEERAGTTFEIAIPFGSAHLPADGLRPDANAGAASPMRLAFVEEVAGWLPEPAPAPPGRPSGTAWAGAEPMYALVAATPHVRQRILIAEDNADMRSYLRRLLDPLGEVEAVENGEAAVQSIRRSRPDLIVSDVMMPRLDGLGLLAWLRSDPGTAGIPFVLLSAKAGEESRIEGLRLGADDFLAKPFSARELLARAATQLKLGEARRIAETERSRLHEFFMRSPIPMVIMLGPAHRFFLANEPYEKLVGRKVVGKTVIELFDSQETDVFIPLLDGVYSSGEPLVGTELEFRLPDIDGALQSSFLDVSYQPFREMSGEIGGILAIVVDATERVRARQTIEDALARLTEERELRERVVTTLTHDLRSPLSVVHMNGILLHRMLHDPEAVKGLADRIIRNALRADAMLCDLLDANRLQAGEQMPISPETCRLDVLLSTIAEGLTELHGNRFRMINEAGAVVGQWDGKAIRRLVENLAGNAVNDGKGESPVTVSLAQAGDQVEIAVHNEGNPISPTDQEAIFQPFHRAGSALNGNNSGWGIGLTLVKGIAEAHGGSARVESDPVGGTTFLVRLPIRRSPR